MHKRSFENFVGADSQRVLVHENLCSEVETEVICAEGNFTTATTTTGSCSAATATSRCGTTSSGRTTTVSVFALPRLGCKGSLLRGAVDSLTRVNFG